MMKTFLEALFIVVAMCTVFTVGAVCLAPLIWFGTKFAKRLERMMERIDNGDDENDGEVCDVRTGIRNIIWRVRQWVKS